MIKIHSSSPVSFRGFLFKCEHCKDWLDLRMFTCIKLEEDGNRQEALSTGEIPFLQ